MGAMTKPEQTSILVRVRYISGAYTTATVKGCRASSTSSALEAGRRLAGKLWGEQAAACDATPPDAPTATDLVQIAPSLGALS
jgi:hypothetical protein